MAENNSDGVKKKMVEATQSSPAPVDVDTQWNLTTGITPLKDPELEKSEIVKETEQVQEAVKQTEEDLNTINEKEIETAKENKEADLDRIEEQAKQKEEIITSTADKIQQQEDETRARLEEEKNQQIDLLEEREQVAKDTAEAERKRLEAEAEMQRIKNERAIVEARANIEIERQQSAWAYQKIGLWFSSGIINQSQQIATEGIQRIAEIKAQMNYNQAVLWVEQAKVNASLRNIELEYSSLINDTISNYSNKIDDLDMSTEQRLAQVQSDLLATQQEKDNRTDAILKEYRDNVNGLERQHINDVLNIKKEWLNLAKQMDSIVKQEQSIAGNKINSAIEMWTWFGKSELEKNKMLREAGLTGLDGVNIEKKFVNDGMLNRIEEIMPKWYVIDEANKIKIRRSINDLLDTGYSMDEAVRIGADRVLTQTDEYKEGEKVKELTSDVQIKKLKDALKPKLWSTAPKIIDKIYNEDGQRVYVYDNWDTAKVVESVPWGGKRILSGQKPSSWSKSSTMEFLEAFTSGALDEEKLTSWVWSLAQ